jgi:DNA-binding NtrC family response regulator
MTQANVLLVDDEPDVLEILEATLQHAGYQTRCFENGHTAATVDPSAIDLLITDIRMPGPLNGVRLARTLRDQRADLPVLFLSGDLNGLADSGDVAPPSAFLVKPIDPDALIEAARDLLSPSPTRDAPKAKP